MNDEKTRDHGGIAAWHGRWVPVVVNGEAVPVAKKLPTTAPIKRVPKLTVVVRDESGAEVVVEGDEDGLVSW